MIPSKIYQYNENNLSDYEVDEIIKYHQKGFIVGRINKVTNINISL